MTTIQMIMAFLGIGAAGVVIFIIVAAIPSKHSQRIKFNDFANLYVINPDRWELHDSYVDFIKLVEGYYRTWKETIMFQFNVKDYYRYRYWKANLEKQKRQEKECKQLQEVISILKSDLEKFENKNVDNMNKATKEIGIIVEGLKENSTKAYELVQTLHSKYGATTATIDFHNPLGIGPKTRDKVFGDKEE